MFGWYKAGLLLGGQWVWEVCVGCQHCVIVPESVTVGVSNTETEPAAPSGSGWEIFAGLLSASTVQMLNHHFEFVRVKCLCTGVTDVNPHPACSSDAQTAANINT